ncbi:WXG100 family type VII secretion target [Phycicoccus duodecadis]|jgi:early secretory antigenic target protein ESAT-6|uniref:ESAT-6-like protein n=1 Tax=Phycicoccus duodecadis TaxID=173053 RepID=A0A2N3YML6_9MICO|nr:WXG100 family type VII secretion target [Phycicoccus duodecadis]PKW28048.1 WXG100 family type VII secretion target [Phycicoccus duodecadis]
MSGDGIKVGGAGIDNLVQDMKTGLGALERRLGDMKNDLSPYVEQWDGSARAAYRQAQADWDKQIEECRLLLEDVRTAVISSKEDYLNGELRNTNMWG